jgi:hypothetical protein
LTPPASGARIGYRHGSRKLQPIKIREMHVKMHAWKRQLLLLKPQQPVKFWWLAAARA